MHFSNFYNMSWKVHFYMFHDSHMKVIKKGANRVTPTADKDCCGFRNSFAARRRHKIYTVLLYPY